MDEEQKGPPWTRPLVNDIKSAVKADLDAVMAESGEEARLERIIHQIKELENELSENGQLKRYVYCVSAFVHEDRYGKVKPAHLNRAFEIAEQILVTHGIASSNSRLSFLYGELHQARSQILLKQGLHWDATWELLQACRARPVLPETEARQVLGKGLRSLRQGDFDYAEALFQQAETYELPLRQIVTLKMARVVMLRLLAQHDRAKSVLEEILAHKDLNDREILSAEWHRLCIDLFETGDPVPMVLALGQKGRHRTSHFMLEGHILLRAMNATEAVKRLSQVSTVARPKSLGASKEGFIFRCAQVLEQIEDDTVPLDNRIRDLGRLLSQRSQLPYIDVELLLLAAAIQWLSTHRLREIASYVVLEYRALCLRISRGTKPSLLPFVEWNFDLTDISKI